MKALVVAAALAAATPGHAAILLQQTVTASGGIADFSGSSDLPALLDSGTIWVGVSGGALTAGSWEIEGELAKLWWDPIGGGFDENDNPIPALTGNEYTYIPGCTASVGQTAQCTGPVEAQIVESLFRVDFTRPADSNTCSPIFTGDTGDCAFSYRFDRVNYALKAAASGDVTFTVYDINPALVPEPSQWVLLVGGFGIAGAVFRRQRRTATA